MKKAVIRSFSSLAHAVPRQRPTPQRPRRMTRSGTGTLVDSLRPT
jgi:hypothetical protein